MKKATRVTKKSALVLNPRADLRREYFTPEGCHILESWNDAADDAVSIARARVEPGVTTRLHRLRGVVERYLIIEGEGKATVGGMEPEARPGDVVVIPAGASQQIANTGAHLLAALQEGFLRGAVTAFVANSSSGERIRRCRPTSAKYTKPST